MVWQLIGNYPRHWNFLLMTCLPSSMPWLGGRRCLMRSSKQESSLVPSAASPGSMVVPACHNKGQKVKGFLHKHTSWDPVLHLMCSGSVVHIVATWCALIGGVNAPLMWLSGFPLVLSFLCRVFKLPFFFSFLFAFPFLSPLLLYASSPSCSTMWFSCAFPSCGCFLWGMSFSHLLYSL